MARCETSACAEAKRDFGWMKGSKSLGRNVPRWQKSKSLWNFDGVVVLRGITCDSANGSYPEV